MNTNKILVIEDHPLFATGIKDLVEFVATNADIVCAASMTQALQLCGDSKPALIITDLRLPDLQGQGVIDRLSAQFPDVPLMIMSGDSALLHSIQTSQHAPSWLISKAEGFEQTSAILLEALTRAGVNVQWRPNALSNRHSNGDHITGRSGVATGIQLTQKQQMVMHYLASGLSNKEIARKLDLSPETIKTHLREIFTRMNVKNRTQAVSLYRKIPRLNVSSPL
ncbi:MAG TPA: response regulator transcription factor [Limnobacter sp.]|uniref:response regulator transcription factor n=1 Tax=Limnobacter sp. TaxID=2003368 RepID=UPI002E30DEED|nr:response regulator transcription factor [Limnobacter sp.]HEX5486166.1 response regulator transcription factor [Limnobacter sp.]